MGVALGRNKGTWDSIFSNIAKSGIDKTECDVWNKLHDMLLGKIAELKIGISPEPFRKWADFVGRFCFQHGRTSEHRSDESEGMVEG